MTRSASDAPELRRAFVRQLPLCPICEKACGCNPKKTIWVEDEKGNAIPHHRACVGVFVPKGKRKRGEQALVMKRAPKVEESKSALPEVTG